MIKKCFLGNIFGDDMHRSEIYFIPKNLQEHENNLNYRKII